MAYNEDAQPNEVRHARKGDTRIPTVRSSRPAFGVSYRSYGPARGRGFGHNGRGGARDDTNHPRPTREKGIGAECSQAASSQPSTSGQPHEPLPPFRGDLPPLHTRAWGGRRGRKRKTKQVSGLSSPGPNHFPAAIETPRSVPSGDQDGSSQTGPGKRRDDELSLPTLDANHSTPVPVLAKSISSTSVSPWPGDSRYDLLSISPSRKFRSPTASPIPSLPKQESVRLSSQTRGNVSLSMKEFLSEPPKSAVEPDADPLPTSNAFARESPLAGTLVDSTRSSSTPARAQQRAADAFIPTHLSDRQAGSESTYAIPQWGHWATPKSPLMFRSGTLVLARPQLPNVSDSPSRSTSDSLLQQLPGSHRDIQSVSHMSDTAPQHSNAVGSVLCKSSHSPAVERDYVYPGSVERGNRPLAMVDRQQIVQLRKDPHDKPRRLFVSPEGSILSVTMRGCFDLVERPNSKSPISLRAALPPVETNRPTVDDACVAHDATGSTVVLGHAGNSLQLSLVRLERARTKDAEYFDRPVQSDKNGGISTVCALMQPGLFATGGYDHLVHLWSFSPNKPPKTTGPLTIKHSSLVQSMLAIRDTSHKLLTASADCSVSVFDLASERVVNTLKLSNSIYHVHPALSEFCNLLEVAHRELQFEVRDHRLVPTTPVVRFGFSSTRLHGRFVRGAMQGTTFMSGGSEKDGCVRLWDLRKTTDVMKTVPCLPGRKVIQVAFGNEEMVACSEDHHLAFMNRIGDLAEGAAP